MRDDAAQSSIAHRQAQTAAHQAVLDALHFCRTNDATEAAKARCRAKLAALDDRIAQMRDRPR